MSPGGGIPISTTHAITGSILGNTLLVLGASFLAGGLRNGLQTFNQRVAGMNASMLALAVIGGLVFSTVLSLVFVPAMFMVMDDLGALCWRFGKKLIVSADRPGFIVNRILLPMINEAVYTLYEGVGSVDSIDTAMRLGAHHPMGPLELADFIGLDVCNGVMVVLHEGLGEERFKPPQILTDLVAAGHLGQKTKQGFYRYPRA